MCMCVLVGQVVPYVLKDCNGFKFKKNSCLKETLDGCCEWWMAREGCKPVGVAGGLGVVSWSLGVKCVMWK
jgi:hypothetical protein